MAEDYLALLNLTEEETDAVDLYTSDNDYGFVCQPENITYYPSVLGTTLAVPEWEAILTAITLTLIILLTIVGNILVILSVFTYKPLRIVQNFFIVSLAVADLTVAILVLPFNVAVSILGRWDFGMHLCKIWLTSDILCCTASILNLCAIALDRYWAITDPINYAQQRTFKRVLIMIVGVWLLSGLISSPPLIGWNDWPNSTEWTSDTPCALTSQQGYVVYSSLGSFFIPLFIMTIVYVEIFIATKRRLRDRAKASERQLNMVKQNVTANPQAAIISPKDHEQAETSHDRDSISSETKNNDHPIVEEVPSGKSKEKKRKAKKKQKQDGGGDNRKYLTPMLVVEDSMTDNHDSPSGSQHGQSGKHGEDGQTTTTNTDSPRSRTQEAPSPSPVVPVVAALPKKSPVYTFIEEKQRISLSKERRAARTLGIIMGVFVFCWLPFFLMYVILPFCSGCCPSEKFKNFITWLGYINSALNPIIYTIFNMDFRRAFKKLLHMKP